MLQSQTIETLILNNLSKAKRIRLENNISGSRDDAYSFIITCLELIFPDVGYRKLKECITDDYDDVCFDVIYFNQDEKKIYIMDIKKTEGFKVAATVTLKNNLENYIFSKPNNYDDVNENIKNKIEEIHQKLHQNWKIKIFVIRGDLANPSRQVTRILNEFKNNYDSFDEYCFLNSKDLIEYQIKNEYEKNYFNWSLEVIKGNPSIQSNTIIIKPSRNDEITSLIAMWYPELTFF